MDSHSTHFDRLVKTGNPVGEVVGVNKFLIKVKGLQPCQVQAIVMFEDGSKGFVHEVRPSEVLVLHLGTNQLNIGMVVVVQHQSLVTKVGKGYIGRVISVTAAALDGREPVKADTVWPVFNPSPPLYQRKLVDTQVETGVMAIDALLPLVRGQRMAMLGDTKSGKSTLATQMTINQKNTDQIVVYCLIAKRRSDIDALLSRLNEAQAMDKVIVVVSTIFESLILSYLAPYVACSMAEYLWQKEDKDVIIVYDDLTAHAHTHREISLLSGVNPGRDSYPGDMFYSHSSLLERAGRLNKSGKALTAIPLVHVNAGDISAYLPTNVMSITDGQWILDMDIFRSGIRPAINFGLSVTRAGGTGHNARQKAQAAKALKILADYRQAQEFSHFGTELSDESKFALDTGRLINEILVQAPGQTYDLVTQQLMLGIIINLEPADKLDVNKLKMEVGGYRAKIEKDEDFNAVMEDLKKVCVSPKAPSPQDKAANQNNSAAKPTVVVSDNHKGKHTGVKS